MMPYSLGGYPGRKILEKKAGHRVCGVPEMESLLQEEINAKN